MKYFSLILSALFRSKTRTLLTLLSVVAALLLFGLLDSVRVAFNSGGSVAGADRLVVASRLSITPEYFSRVLGELVSQGLIEVDKREIDIPDVGTLASYQER